MCWRQSRAAADARCANRGFKVSDFPENDMSDLEIKKRARRRLVGATVLALLAVIVLPIAVKNSEEPRTVSDMQVSIPERDEIELSRIIPEGDPKIAQVDIEPDAASGAPGFSAETSPPESPPPSVQPKPETPPVVQLPKQPPPPAAGKDAEAARALALLNDKPSTKEAAKSAGQDQVFVQVAAFSKADSAKKQAEELKKQGFAAYAEKAGKVTRVRIGPLARGEAEQIVARLDAQGHKNATLLSR